MRKEIKIKLIRILLDGIYVYVNVFARLLVSIAALHYLFVTLNTLEHSIIELRFFSIISFLWIIGPVVNYTYLVFLRYSERQGVKKQ